MGFPGTEEGWASLAGAAIFPGADGGAGIWTVIGIVACVVILVMGNAAEAKKYKK